MLDSHIAAAPPLHVAVSDGDTGFVQVLTKRLDRLGWEHVVLTGAVPTARLVAMRLRAFVIDLALLGPEAWSWIISADTAGVVRRSSGSDSTSIELADFAAQIRVLAMTGDILVAISSDALHIAGAGDSGVAFPAHRRTQISH